MNHSQWPLINIWSVEILQGANDVMPHKRAISQNTGYKLQSTFLNAGNINVFEFERDRRLQRVKQFVDQHYDERLPLTKVAAIAGLEQTYFSRYFHEKTGVCYHDWLHWVRICHAIELLKERALSVTTIAFAVGYQDLRTFERAFEKITGECPSHMKKAFIDEQCE